VFYIVGVGPGDPEYITVKAINALRRCTVIAGWRSVLARVSQFVKGKRIIELTYRDQEESLARLAAESLNADVCLVVHGDPMVSEWELIRRVSSLGVPYQVINGVSFMNVALAKIGLDASHVLLVSQHARTPQPIPRNCTGRGIIIIPPPDPEGRKSLAESLRSLLDRGCRVTLLENLTLPDERITELNHGNVDSAVIGSSQLSAIAVVCGNVELP